MMSEEEERSGGCESSCISSARNGESNSSSSVYYDISSENSSTSAMIPPQANTNTTPTTLRMAALQTTQLVVNHSQPGHENRLGDFLRQLKCSGYKKLPESCGLSITELEAMAARQARQLETQEQLLAAKAQRLRYLKSGGEAERLQRLREKVTSQEERLRKLRALRGKVQTNRNGNSVLNSDLESLRAVFNEKEKELSLAVAKVDELTRQLEDLRRGNKEPTNGQSVAAVELDKLRRELMYRQKLREAQATRVAAQKAALVQRQEEAVRVDRRIAELQERLHRKRLLNHQIAATLNHQENELGVPNKNDPKYQTLPYNAKLFAPFINKQHQQQHNFQVQQYQHQDEQDQFESVLQQMQLINMEQQGNTNNMTTVQSMNFENNLRLHQLLSQSQIQHSNTNTKSATGGIITSQQQQQQQQQQGIHSNGGSGGPQTVHSSLTSANVSKGKALPVINNNSSESTFNALRPNNFPSTGTSNSGNLNNADLNSLLNSQVGTKKEHTTSSVGSSGSSISNFSDGFISTHSNGQNGPDSLDRSSSKPALPPKPAKPTPPPRQAHDVFTYNNSRGTSSSSEVGGMMPDRTELPIKPKPLFLKKSASASANMTIVSSNLSSTQGSAVMEKESNNSNSATVRMAINHRRFELPPAFLFPEGDPPPLDLIPEHTSVSSSGGSQADAADCVDAAPFSLHKSGPLLLSHGGNIEEYTLPDLFPHPPMISSGGGTTSSTSSSYLPSTNNKSQQHQYIQQDTTTNKTSGSQINSNHHDGSDVSADTLSQTQSNLTIARVNANQINLNSNSTTTNGNLTTSSSHASSSLQSGLNCQEIETTTEIGNCGGEIMNFCLENGNKIQENHISVMNIRIGRESPQGSGEIKSDINQLEVYEVGMESGSPNLSEQSPDREETTMSDSTTNSGGSNSNTNMVGIIRRVKKGNLKTSNREHSVSGRRVSFDPLALLLDASLEGELDLVMKTAGEVGNPSAANDEGITALHNAICAGHAEVVRFLVEFGCDVNAQDSDGWTPLHCAASCNNVGMVKFLVERGACIFATTLSDHETAAEKCEEDEDGFGPCSEYLYSIQEKLGIINSGVVYGVFEYEAQNPDELCFRDRDRLMILRKGDEFEREWWWATLGDKQGYVPRNLLGLYPRVVPQKRNES